MFFKKEPPPPKPTLLQKVMKIKNWLASSVAIMAALVYWYGFIAPDFTGFQQTEVTGIVVGDVGQARSLFVSIKSNKIPEIPVTISFIVDDTVVAHRHYSEGIPAVKGRRFAEGVSEFVEPVPLLFTITSPKLTVRFSFSGVTTLMRSEVHTFTTNLLDGNPQDTSGEFVFKPQTGRWI